MNVVPLLPPDELKMLADFNCRSRIIRHMALAFFCCAWSSYSEEVGPHYPAGCELMDAMPEELDPAALAAAHKLAEEIEAYDGTDLHDLLEQAAEKAEPGPSDSPCDEEHFGHYLAMSAMGHGVGLECIGLEHDWCHIPYIEFSWGELDPEVYPDTRESATA